MSNNDKKWSSNAKAGLLFENFRKFVEEGDFSPVMEVKVSDFVYGDDEMNKRKYSSIPVGVLISILEKHPELKEKAKMAADVKGQMEAFKEIAQLMNNDAEIKRHLKGIELKDIVNLPGFLQYAENKGLF